MQFIEKLKQLIVQLSLQQKIALVAVTAISLISILFLLLWANRPEYGLLYSKLEAGDMAQIVEDLKSSNISYKLKDGGSTILVPTKDIYELRIKYAGQNLISSGAVGYELFDKNNLGLTEFMQKVNLKRALQGELSKTINQIEAVQQSRVHLVIPEPSLFEDQETKSSASVIVKLKPNSVLNQKQILGITQLVAGSVEGLTPENVIIVDSYGNILTKISNGVDDIGLSNNQLELKQKVEKYLSQKAQTMLDAVLGENNSIVRVSAVLNFNKINRTSERYDPDNTAILSEERNEERSTKEDTSLFQRENVITNYEINKVVEQFEGSTGDIKQLSIAVFINGILKQEENSEAGAKETFVPRSQEEIDKITENVKSAVGFREDRNDKIVVQQLAFDRTLINREQEILASIEKREFRNDLIKTGLIVLGCLLIFFMLRSVFKKFGIEEFVKRQQTQLLSSPKLTTEHLIGAGEVGTKEGSEDVYSAKLSNAAKIKLQAQEKVTKEVSEFTEMDPERAARILRFWLLEAEKE